MKPIIRRTERALTYTIPRSFSHHTGLSYSFDQYASSCITETGNVRWRVMLAFEGFSEQLGGIIHENNG